MIINNDLFNYDIKKFNNINILKKYLLFLRIMGGTKIKEWKDYVSEEKILKSFSINIETLGYIKLFMDEYGIEDQDQAIEHLVNIGLVSLNYKENNDLTNESFYKQESFKIQSNLKEKNEDKTNVSKSQLKEQDYGFNALAFEQSNPNQQEQIYKIINEICKRSLNGYATKDDIISQAEKQSINSTDVTRLLDSLKRDGRIYEPVVNQYKNQY